MHYILPRAGHVTIQVFSLAGDLIDVLYTDQLAAGEHSTAWDGRNSGGRVVARGMYFIFLSYIGAYRPYRCSLIPLIGKKLA